MKKFIYTVLVVFMILKLLWICLKNACKAVDRLVDRFFEWTDK